MTRKLTLGLAALAVAGVVVVSLWRGLGTASEGATAVVPPQDAVQRPSAVSTDDELTPAAPDAPTMIPAGAPAASARVEPPDPLEPVVKYLRRANPALYGELSTEDARALTELDLGWVPLSDAGLALLMDMPALERVVLDTSDLMAPNRRRILCFGVGRVQARRVTATIDVESLRYEVAPKSAK